jgi:hypothetical protein
MERLLRAKDFQEALGIQVEHFQSHGGSTRSQLRLHRGVCSALNKSNADNTSDHDEDSHLHRLSPHGRTL